MRVISSIIVLMWISFAKAEVPDWYKRDIVNIIQKAESVIIYKVNNVKLHSKNERYYTYIINTETIEKLKGSAPNGNCYFIYAEGEWKSPKKVGDKSIAILDTKYNGKCGVIESGRGAPASDEYIQLFRSILIGT